MDNEHIYETLKSEGRCGGQREQASIYKEVPKVWGLEGVRIALCLLAYSATDPSVSEFKIASLWDELIGRAYKNFIKYLPYL